MTELIKFSLCNCYMQRVYLRKINPVLTEKTIFYTYLSEKKYDLKFLCHFDSTLYFFFPLLFELHQIPFLLNM